MRKENEQQKNRDGIQLELFKPLSNPVHTEDSVSVGNAVTGDEFYSQLTSQRASTKNLLEDVVSYQNLNRAYHQVSSNKGSGGIDQMDTQELKTWFNQHHKEFISSVLNETYEVSAVRKVIIPKPNGGERILGIPTVRDRLLQQSIHQKLILYYDPLFSESSYGFRPGRSAHQAIQQAAKYVKGGNEWVVDIDLENFFDKVNHDRLMQRLSKGVGDKRLLRLIHAYLRAGMMSDGITQQRTAGTPQGSPLSPLLSNIVLDELDKELEKRGHKFCRYADDCNIYVKSRKAGERVLASIIKFIETKLKLKVNRQKSGVKHCSEAKYLGYTILSGGYLRVSDASVQRLKNKVREITRRNRGVRFTQIIKELNQMIGGWYNYFRLANRWLSNLRDLDGWIRRKLRCYRMKQCGRKITIVKFLLSREIDQYQSWNVALYSHGWWNMSKKLYVSQAMNNKWFAQQGLYSIYTRFKR